MFPGEPSAIVAPDTVVAGAAFEVHFTSYESRCTTRGRDSLSVHTDTILTRSTVTVNTGECGDALLIMPHTVSVQVGQPGKFLIVVSGRKYDQVRPADTVLTRDLVAR